MATRVDDSVIDKLNIMDKRYKRNLDFFEKKVPAIFAMINADESQPSITIDPASKQIHKMRNGKPVYDKDPISHALNEVKDFEDRFNEKVYPPRPLGITLTHLIKEAPFTKTANYYGDILAKHGRENLKPSVKDIVIFGIGLGYHIEMLCNKMEFKNITIIDHEIKNLKASMYCINWEKILTTMSKGRSITIHVGRGPDHRLEFEQALKNHCFRLFPTIGISTIIYNHQPDADSYNEDKAIIEEFATYIKVSNELIGPEAQRLFNANENIQNGFKAIDLNSSKISSEKIISVVGAGPSLDIYIDIIKEHRDKFFLISAGSSLSSLLKLNVEPDLHFELEFQNLATILLKYINQEYDLKKLSIVCTFESNPGFPSLFENAYMFIPESSELVSEFEERNILRQGGITCSNGATAFISRITQEDIYLFGLDFAHTNGMHHSKTNISMNEDLPENLSKVHTIMKKRASKIQVKDTNGNNILTSAGLNAARISMESALKTKKNNFYNCSYGANIDGTIFTSLDKIEEIIIKKENLKNNVNFTPITKKIDKNKIHNRTIKLLKKSIESGKKIINFVGSFSDDPQDNTLKVIEIFRMLQDFSKNDNGQLRNMFSVSKAPLLQLFVICNYTPKNEQSNIISIWLSDYREYIKFLSDLFNKACDNEDYLVSEDWVE